MIHTGYKFPNDFLKLVSDEYISSTPTNYEDCSLVRADTKHGIDFYLKYPLLFSFDCNFATNDYTFVKDGSESLEYFFKNNKVNLNNKYLILNQMLLGSVPNKFKKNVLSYYIKDTRICPEKSMELVLDWDKVTFFKNLSEFEVLENLDFKKIGISGIFFYHLVKLGYFDNSFSGADIIEQFEISPYHTLVIYRPEWSECK